MIIECHGSLRTLPERLKYCRQSGQATLYDASAYFAGPVKFNQHNFVDQGRDGPLLVTLQQVDSGAPAQKGRGEVILQVIITGQLSNGENHETSHKSPYQ
jgi:hypothetical protein